MFDTITGSLTIAGHRFDRSLSEMDLGKSGVTLSEGYFASETGLLQDGELAEVHLTFAFTPAHQLKSIVAYSLNPRLSGWGDITVDSEANRAANNSKLVGINHPTKQQFSWGFVQLAIDPREAIAKVWIEYNL